jgi:hypothetical protein
MKRLIRNAVASFAIMIPAGATATLAAQQVSAPTGAVLPRGLPILVQWSPASYWPPPTVRVILNQVVQGGHYPVAPIATVNNTGQTHLTLPASFPCNPASTYMVSVEGAVNSTTTRYRNSANFKLSCGSGSLTVVKTVINESGRPVPNGSFPVDVTCGSSGGITTLALTTANGFRDSVMYLPHGVTCFVNEPAPKAPAGCSWTRTYPQGKSVEIGYTARRLDVHNRLRCQGGTTTGVRSPH